MTDPSFFGTETEVGGPPQEGSTYDPSANRQPTNQGGDAFIGTYLANSEVPTIYLSLRVTTPHNTWDTLVKPHIDDASWYISYPHSGKNGNNEHFHVFLSGVTASDRERYRKRFRSAGFTGNQHVSLKLMQNGVTSAITYGAREGTEPICKGPLCASWIRDAPEWVEQRASKKRSGDDFIELTCKNLIKVAFEFHRQEKLKTTCLAKTMQIMLERGVYVMSPTLVRQGAPNWYLELFRESVETGKLSWNAEVWKTGVFRDFSGR